MYMYVPWEVLDIDLLRNGIIRGPNGSTVPDDGIRTT